MSAESTHADVAKWAKQLTQDRADLLAIPAFCRVMHEMLGACGVYRLSFAGEQTHATAFNEGMRNVGNILITQLEAANPSALLLLKQHAMPTKESPDE